MLIYRTITFMIAMIDYDLYSEEKTFLLNAGFFPKFNNRPTSISVAFK